MSTTETDLGERIQALKDAARADIMQEGTLASVLRGIGSETADPTDVRIVSVIVGHDVRPLIGLARSRANVALLRANLRRWAVRESCGLPMTGGAA